MHSGNPSQVLKAHFLVREVRRSLRHQIVDLGGMTAALSHRVGDATPANVHNGEAAALGLRPRVRSVIKPVATCTDVHVQNNRNAALAGPQVLCVGVGIMDDHASNSFLTADLLGRGGGGRGGN